MGALMKEYGGFEFILQSIKNAFASRKGGMFGIGILTALMDIAAANNTVAIVMAGPIAKDITEEFDIDPRKTASLMDTFSCICQGIIPYGAQLLIAAAATGITSLEIMPFLFYQFALLIAVCVSILITKNEK
jgi:Na+/H+ antiporter NhaC